MGTGSKLILAFVALIIAAVLIPQIATQGNLVTEKKWSGTETFTEVRGAGGVVNGNHNFTIANPPTGWKQEDCTIGDFVLKNVSGYTMTDGTDYTFNQKYGNFTIKSTIPTNMSSLSNTTTATYTYCGDDYTNLNWGRTAINTTMGLYAIGAFLISVGLFYSVYKDVKD